MGRMEIEIRGYYRINKWDGLAGRQVNPKRYRRLVGKLNYLTISHPDISFAVSVVSQYMAAPCLPHWEASLRIVRYLKAHPGRGLLYRANGHL